MKSNKDQVPNLPDGKAVTGASGRGFDLEPVAGGGGGGEGNLTPHGS